MLPEIFLHIQRQSRERREYYALVGAVLLTFFITLLWVGYIAMFAESTSYAAISSDNNQSLSANADSTSQSAPLGGFWEQLIESLGGGDEIGEASDVTTSKELVKQESASTHTTSSPADNIVITHESTAISTSTQPAKDVKTSSSTTTRP